MSEGAQAGAQGNPRESERDPGESEMDGRVETDAEVTRDERGTSPPRMVDVKWAITGGVLATFAAMGGMMAIGTVGSYEARQLLEATLPTIRFLSSSAMTASATILALMLTLLSFSQAHDSEFKESHYVRILQVSWMAAATIIAATILLLLLSIPLEESEEVRTYYEWIYYAILVASAGLGGMVVTMILMLYNAIRGLVGLFRSAGESPLVPSD